MCTYASISMCAHALYIYMYACVYIYAQRDDLYSNLCTHPATPRDVYAAENACVRASVVRCFLKMQLRAYAVATQPYES